MYRYNTIPLLFLPCSVVQVHYLCFSYPVLLFRSITFSYLVLLFRSITFLSCSGIQVHYLYLSYLVLSFRCITFTFLTLFCRSGARQRVRMITVISLRTSSTICWPL